MLYKLILLAFFFEYFRPGYYFPVLDLLKLNTLIPVSALLLTIATSKIVPTEDVLKSNQGKFFFFLLFLLVLSTLTADVTLFSWRTVKLEIGYFFLFLLISKEMYTTDRLKGLFIVLILAHILLVYFNQDIVLRPEIRSYIQGTTFLGDGNDFALSISILIPLCIFLVSDAKGTLKKLFFILILATLCMVVIGTSSRGGTLAVAGSLFYMWLFAKRKIYGVVAMSVLVVLVLIYAPPTYFTRMQSIQNYEEDGSAMGRIIAWKTALQMAADNPVLGVGAGHFSVKLGTEYRPKEFGERELPWLTAHSMYFLVIGELGLPGIFYLLGLLYWNYKSNARILKEIHHDSRPELVTFARLTLCVNSGLIAFAIAGAFLSVLYYPHIFVLSGIVFAVNRNYQKLKEELNAEEDVAVNDQPNAIGEASK